MSPFRQSDSFNNNFLFWKIFGLWPGRVSTKYYKYYSIIYLVVTLLIYNILLSINLYYTPLTIESLIREVIFYFTEITVTAKVLMIVVMRKEILRAFEILDSTTFTGDDFEHLKIVKKYNNYYKTYWKSNSAISHFAFLSEVFIPLLTHVILDNDMKLPICNYYFLSKSVRDRYFCFWYLYQSACMYGHMMYNVTVDCFIAGMMILSIAQFKVIHCKLENIRSDFKDEFRKESDMLSQLNSCLLHYELLLSYCTTLQQIFNVTMFIQFGVAAAIICVILCGLLLPSTTETYMFLISYLFAMILQIFVPGWLGTQISYESQELTTAAYKSDWIPRSEKFKRSLRLFVERNNTPIVFTGLKMFPLSLGSFTSDLNPGPFEQKAATLPSEPIGRQNINITDDLFGLVDWVLSTIMKSSYSFFTLLRNVQDR